MKSTAKNLLIILPALLLLFSCSAGEAKKNEITDIDSSVSSGPEGTILADGDQLLQVHCMTCHTLRYIQMQPAFPRKTWKKITDKMIQNFGAPIADSTETKIVDYLMVIKGRK